MITIAYITARPECQFDWFFDSLRRNSYRDQIGQIIVVDQFAEAFDSWTDEDARQGTIQVHALAKEFSRILQHVPPKPNVWNGKHRLTPRNWWGASNARNTALCYATGDFIAYLDDRCVIVPTWMDAVVEAKDGNYAVCGIYEKRTHMSVVDGAIVAPGTIIGVDARTVDQPECRRVCPGEWMYGCTFALPLEWMLNINGFDESWDSVSMEDTHFGRMVANNGYPVYHDTRMKMIEDRTPNEEINDPLAYRTHDMKRSSKEKHPHDQNDKTHTIMRRVWDNKQASHAWNFRQIRESILAGGQFPIPEQPTHDWFDGQSLASMT